MGCNFCSNGSFGFFFSFKKKSNDGGALLFLSQTWVVFSGAGDGADNGGDSGHSLRYIVMAVKIMCGGVIWVFAVAATGNCRNVSSSTLLAVRQSKLSTLLFSHMEKNSE